jgi:tetratricopeptide (TPR) repeat protein
MIDSKSDGSEVEASAVMSRWIQYGFLAATCLLVIGVYAYTAQEGFVLSSSLNAADNYYNLLVQGFRAGHLNLKTDVPPNLAQVADPFGPSAPFPHGVIDMSYYRGKLYLYYGITPALLLFWPYVALTGDYLTHHGAAVMLCVTGLLACAGLLYALWRRYFAEVSVAVVAAGTLALGLVTFTPLLLARCDVYEVSISCGYAFTMLALAAIWKALHEPQRRGRWLALASLTYGLAVGARPSLLFGALILLLPVVQAWREHRKIWPLLLAASGPMILIGLGLMLYNQLRFDNPFEFGIRYALAGDRQQSQRFFSLRYLWFHFRVYGLALARWSGQYPFVHDIAAPPLPAGHGRVEHPFGVLTNIPVVWLALAMPLAWRDRSAESRCLLRGFMMMLVMFFGICALTVSSFFSASARYELEFLPALVLLAVIGILSLERTLASQPVRRRVARWVWILLLGFSVAFNLLARAERSAEAHYNLGVALQGVGQIEKATEQYEQALRLKPDYAEAHYNLGVALQGVGQIEKATEQYEQALRLKPDYAEAHYNLGVVLQGVGQIQEAISHWEQALRLRPDFADAHNNLGIALMLQGRLPEAIDNLEQALRLKPDDAEAHNNLGVALERQDRLHEAIEHLQQALRLKPDNPKAHYNLAVALMRQGRSQEAIEHLEQALRLNPDAAEARNFLARARAVQREVNVGSSDRNVPKSIDSVTQ